jgi:hypothetical protein
VEVTSVTRDFPWCLQQYLLFTNNTPK